MNTIFVGLMTLMPALVTLVLVIGVPVLITASLLPEIRLHSRRVLSAVSRPDRAGYLRDVIRQARHPKAFGGRRKATPA